MNICMFTNTYLPHVGGVARSVHIFSEDLRQKGHRVLVVAPEFSQDDKARKNGVDVLRVPALQNFNGSDFSVRIAIPFLIDQAIDSFEPDVIHSHHPFLLGDAALRAARRRKKPLVLTHHTLYERYTHYVPMDSPGMKRFVIHLSSEYANLCHALVAPSRTVAHLLRERGVKTRIEEIPTGVDVTFFESGQGQAFRSEHGIPSEALVLGHVGRLAPEKNLAYLGEAAIRGMAGREDVWLLIVGEGPSKTEIEKAVEEQGLSDRLVAPGTLTGRTLSDAYRAMDLFVFSSTSETQGMVLAEAMAAGVPVVALDASGCRDVVEDGVNGRLLPADAPAETFSHETLELLRNAGLMKRFKEKAYRTARSLSRETCAGRLEALYAEILAEASDNSPLYRTSLDPWDALLGGLKAEWELISRKTTAAVKSFQEAEGND